MRGSCVKQSTKILASPNTNCLCDRYLLDIILGLVKYQNTFVLHPNQVGYSEKVMRMSEQIGESNHDRMALRKMSPV